MRQFNERVVLQAIRHDGPLPKADIARLTRLTPQTVQVIIGRLEADGLVQRGAPRRGRVGQPSVPMALNRDGAFSIGITIGRRSLEVLLVDFCGSVRGRRTLGYAWPDPDHVFTAIDHLLGVSIGLLGPELRGRLHGVGVAAPLTLDGWRALLGLAPEQAQRWSGVDVADRVQAMTSLPVSAVKDTAAACIAELVSGRGRGIADFLYVFVDTFAGGALVLDGRLHHGLRGNAGAIGSLPLHSIDVPAGAGPPAAAGAGLPPAQLLSVASLLQLQARFEAQGLDAAAAHDERSLEPSWRGQTDDWLVSAAGALALAVHGAACLLDIDHVVVDGTFGRGLQAALVGAIGFALDGYDWEGVSLPIILAGTVGADARAIGGALLPLYANFAPDRALFLKRTVA